MIGIEVLSVSYVPETTVLKLELKNNSSSDLLFENAMDYTFYDSSPVFTIPAEGTKTLQVKTLEEISLLKLKLKALGAYTAPKIHPVIEWDISID